MKKVYILSGPPGVGRSTTSRELVKYFPNSAYISGDQVSHMHVNGRVKPWESQEENRLIWDNILSLTENFLTYDNTVVIDYVTFPHEAQRLYERLEDLNVEVMYIVLWAEKEILKLRDNERESEFRMGERSLIVMEELRDSGLTEKHVLDTTNYAIDDLPTIVTGIIQESKYKL